MEKLADGSPKEILPKPWMTGYGEWCVGNYRSFCENQGVEFKEEDAGPTGLSQIVDSQLGCPVFIVEGTTRTHMRSAENVAAMINHFRSRVPREKNLLVYFGERDSQQADMRRIVPPTSMIGVLEDGHYLEGETAKIYVGGDVSPDQAEKMGWALACMYADSSFVHSIVLPGPKSKYDKLKEFISPLD